MSFATDYTIVSQLRFQLKYDRLHISLWKIFANDTEAFLGVVLAIVLLFGDNIV